MENKYKIAVKVNTDLERELAAITASPAANLENEPGAGEGRLQKDHGPRGWKVPVGTGSTSGAPRSCKSGWKC